MQLLQNNLFRKKQNGCSGSDVRIALIEIYKFIISKDINSSIVRLLSTAVKVCEIMYALDTQRSPRSVLQLYNLTWLHHELCKSQFVKFHEVTHDKFYRLYLHSIVIHALLQYEVLCLRSVNTENQERIFQQAKTIALATTNRKPENVVLNVMLRLQAKQVN